MEEDNPLYLQLHKLSAAISKETLAHILETLWSTRKTGLGPLQKPVVQSLLNLPSPRDVDIVLACLRSIIRKTVREDLTGDDIQKLFPLDLPMELQSILIFLLLKYQNQWKEEASRDQPLWQQIRVSHQFKVNAPSTITPFPASELSSMMWARRDDGARYHSHSSFGSATPIISESNLQQVAPDPLQRDRGTHDNPKTFPRLKTMTWTMENWNSAPSNRTAIISLKLQDYTKSASGEIEVKFQLSRDTLEAMLRSMAYISEQLTSSVVHPSEPLQKKQKAVD